MKYYLFILLVFTSFFLIRNKYQDLPPAILVEVTDTTLQNINGIWMKKGIKFNGYIIEKQNGYIISKVPVLDGKENGTALGWYLNGKKKLERNFLQGKREGIHKGWYPNDTVSFLFVFHDDKYEGEQKTFYESGHPWQSLHYKNGYEEGKQKSWSDSGRVINNFTVKNGKLYGVIGRYDCMSVYKN